MKKILTMLFIGVIPYVAIAQNVKYSYDISGNRIKREIVIKTRSTFDTSEDFEGSIPKESFSDALSGKDIRIYPDQVKGSLKVEILDYDSSDICMLRIFNVSGLQILYTQMTSPVTELDISSCSEGIYVLYISLNNKENTWKIIKQ